MSNFKECFFDFLRSMSADKLNSLKKYLQDSLGLVSSQISEVMFQISRLDDWQSTLQGEISRLEQKILSGTGEFDIMPFVDFVDCLDVGGLSTDMKSLFEGWLDRYNDFKYNLISTTSVQTYLGKVDLYRKDLESRVSEYISAIDEILAEKVTGLF